MQINANSKLITSTPVKTQAAPKPAKEQPSTAPANDSFQTATLADTPGAGVSAMLALVNMKAPEPAVAAPALAAPQQAPPQEVAGPGFDPNNLDRSTSPTQDFYQFAMGGYLAKKPIPADRERYGVDAEITGRNDAAVKDILKELAGSQNKPGSIEQKLGDFFKSGMDTDAIEKAGLTPLQADLDRINAISNRAELSREVQNLHSEGNGVYFSFYGSPDARDASQTIGDFSQGGLSLPEPEYYTSDENKETLQKYEAHVARMFELTGETPEKAQADARAVVSVETKLAKVSLSTAELRDPEALVNKKNMEELGQMSSAFDWSSYLQSQKADGQPTYNVSTPKFFQGLDHIMADTPLEDHKAYLRWHLLSENASALPKAFGDESFNFWGKTLRGLQEQKPRIDRIASATDDNLGEALGVKFVERRFSPEAKTKMLEMVDAFKTALKEKILRQPWMGKDTKLGALEKIATLRAKIGYPDNPQDYKELPIGPSYMENLRASGRYQRARNMAQIGKPTNKDEWGMTASTNNAYYNPPTNEICFPAGILQPPYFDLKADEAMNFGGIGATIGHELGHGFDDEGAQFDAQGNLRNWFAPEDLEKFQKKAEGVEKQFDEYVVEGLPVNGKLVLGEALADLSGLELAYAAFKEATRGKKPEMIDGFTPDQRFFLSFAQSWATNVRPEYAKLMVKSDPHPLPKLRVNGTVSNMTAFHNAFGVREGQPMRRPEEKRNEIWQ